MCFEHYDTTEGTGSRKGRRGWNTRGKASAIFRSPTQRARIAWYYFAGGLTQQEIARKLQITRTRVNRVVGQLRTDGSVRTEIKLSLVDCVELEDRLQRLHGLKSARVIPHMDDEVQQQRAIGEAAGEMLDSMLRDGIGLGVGWGRTLAAALPRIATRDFKTSWVATLMGSLTQGSGSTTFELAAAFAKALDAECYYLAIPIHLPTAISRLLLEAHYDIAKVLERIKRADLAFVSCGDLSERSQLANTRSVAENLDSLKAAGAVGDFLGLFIDENGTPVPHPLNERLIAMRPDDIKNVPETILASGGVHKAVVVRAILRADYVKHLVTDERCAALLLEASR